MHKANLNPLNTFSDSSSQADSKSTKFNAELNLVQAYLTTKIATATMVSVDLEIYRPNLCRYVSILSKQSLLSIVCVGKCKVTGFKARYLTCNPTLINRLNERKGLIG